jgi:AcrR family transcriptional regulator
MADIASEAGISRTTVYRTYPGGRDVIFETLRRHRQLRFFHDLLEPLATGTSLESTMVDTMVLASVLLRDDEGFRTELVREPGLLLKQLTFEGLEQILGISRLVVVPQLTRFVDRREANRLAEWATRIVISHALDPSQHVDLTNRDHVEELVSRRRRRASPDLQQSNIRISESKD